MTEEPKREHKRRLSPEVRFSKFDCSLDAALQEFNSVAEADIGSVHEQRVARPALTGVPDYLYEALVHYCDHDQKTHDAEVAAQQRALELP
jgi:hypothetical protein